MCLVYQVKTSCFFSTHQPFSARYISKDPIGLFGGINTSAYVSDPNQWVDMYGLAPIASRAPTKTRCKYIECSFPNPDYLVCSGGALGSSGMAAVNLNNGNLYRGGGVGTGHFVSTIKELTSLAPKVKTGAGASCIFYTIQNVSKNVNRGELTDRLMAGVSITATGNIGIVSFGVDKPIQLVPDPKNGTTILPEKEYVAVGVGVGAGVDISVGGLQKFGNIKDYFIKPNSTNEFPENYTGPSNLPNVDGVLNNMSNINW